MKGRRPLPTATKQMRGNPGKRRLNDQEPKPELVLPQAPGHLGKFARLEWERVTPLLYNLGLLTGVDLAALEAYCEAYGRYKAQSNLLNDEDEIIETTNGNKIQNPRIGLVNTLRKQVVVLAAEFGMTPSSRSRLHVIIEPEKPQDPEEALAVSLFRGALSRKE